MENQIKVLAVQTNVLFLIDFKLKLYQNKVFFAKSENTKILRKKFSIRQIFNFVKILKKDFFVYFLFGAIHAIKSLTFERISPY